MMANDGARMTNDELMLKHESRRSSGCHAGAARRRVIRCSSFGVLFIALLFALAGCNSSKSLTKANVDEVTEGMAKKQVESILGPPTTVDTKDFALLKKTVYVYNQGKDTVTVVFKDDKVQSKASTLSE